MQGRPRASSTPSWIACRPSAFSTRPADRGTSSTSRSGCSRTWKKRFSSSRRHRGLTEFELKVGPHQLFGIEINPYAFDLAQMTVWIGFIQWQRDNGFPIEHEPDSCSRSTTSSSKDAILDLTDPENPTEPDGPRPISSSAIRRSWAARSYDAELGDDYVERLYSLCGVNGFGPRPTFVVTGSRRPAADRTGKCKRAGLLATQGIRGGANREYSEPDQANRRYFLRESDRTGFLTGRMSMSRWLASTTVRERSRRSIGSSVHDDQ